MPTSVSKEGTGKLNYKLTATENVEIGEKVTVNKNNYTLTFSGQGVISSFIASMVSSTGANLEPAGNIIDLNLHFCILALVWLEA